MENPNIIETLCKICDWFPLLSHINQVRLAEVYYLMSTDEKSLFEKICNGSIELDTLSSYSKFILGGLFAASNAYVEKHAKGYTIQEILRYDKPLLLHLLVEALQQNPLRLWPQKLEENIQIKMRNESILNELKSCTKLSLLTVNTQVVFYNTFSCMKQTDRTSFIKHCDDEVYDLQVLRNFNVTMLQTLYMYRGKSIYFSGSTVIPSATLVHYLTPSYENLLSDYEFSENVVLVKEFCPTWNQLDDEHKKHLVLYYTFMKKTEKQMLKYVCEKRTKMESRDYVHISFSLIIAYSIAALVYQQVKFHEISRTTLIEQLYAHSAVETRESLDNTETREQIGTWLKSIYLPNYTNLYAHEIQGLYDTFMKRDNIHWRSLKRFLLEGYTRKELQMRHMLPNLQLLARIKGIRGKTLHIMNKTTLISKLCDPKYVAPLTFIRRETPMTTKENQKPTKKQPKKYITKALKEITTSNEEKADVLKMLKPLRSHGVRFSWGRLINLVGKCTQIQKFRQIYEGDFTRYDLDTVNTSCLHLLCHVFRIYIGKRTRDDVIRNLYQKIMKEKASRAKGKGSRYYKCSSSASASASTSKVTKTNSNKMNDENESVSNNETETEYDDHDDNETYVETTIEMDDGDNAEVSPPSVEPSVEPSSVEPSPKEPSPKEPSVEAVSPKEVLTDILTDTTEKRAADMLITLHDLLKKNGWCTYVKYMAKYEISNEGCVSQNAAFVKWSEEQIMDAITFTAIGIIKFAYTDDTDKLHNLVSTLHYKIRHKVHTFEFLNELIKRIQEYQVTVWKEYAMFTQTKLGERSDDKNKGLQRTQFCYAIITSVLQECCSKLN